MATGFLAKGIKSRYLKTKEVVMGIVEGLLMALFRKPVSKTMGVIPKQSVEESIAAARAALAAAEEREKEKQEKK